VRGTGGEHVVGVDVDGHHNHERRLPGQPESANQLHQEGGSGGGQEGVRTGPGGDSIDASAYFLDQG
jgi:hypothetical protein